MPRLEYVRCNLCGSGRSEHEVYLPAPAGKKAEKAKGVYSAASHEYITSQIVRCRRCGLIFINPRPKAKRIIDDYSDGEDQDYISQEGERTNTFRESLAFIQKHAKPPGRMLDIGCAAGLFLKVARDAGWEVYGVEPSRWLSAYGRRKYKLNIKTGTLDSVKHPSNYFDVVTMLDVLEHVPDPKALLKEVHRILKPGGLFVVNYPNIGSRLARAFGRRWWFILDMHLYYFTPKTLRAMLEETGYEQFFSKRHYQKLKLGYLIYRIRPYVPVLPGIADFIVRKLGLGNLEMVYYASQMFVLARKK